MATGQSLLNIMEDLNGELQLQSGEANVAKGLRALNGAQDMFETVLAQHPGVLGGQTGTVTTTASTESTSFPTGLLRLDGLDLLDSSTLLPVRPIRPAKGRGGHAYATVWPWTLFATVSSSSTGSPTFYWTNGRNIYWGPLPNGTHSVRWYGFKSADDITASGTFAYPDVCLYPFATLAVQLIKVGLEDPVQDFMALAKELFEPLVDSLQKFDRDGAAGYTYRFSHTT